jgi:ABC-type branched-subunit amino acid transport system substrate-binding protein
MVIRKAPLLAALCAAVLVVSSACRGVDDDGNGDGDIATGVGVTSEPCPEAVNEDNGCIYLGIISDLTDGPFAPLAVPITDAQEAFWARVNADGGIGGYDIDATSHVRDNKYNPEIHRQVFDEIKDDVLALAQTLGSPQTAAIIDDLDANSIVSVPASWSSEWWFEDVILHSGANYCIESMNAVDYAVDELDAESVMAVHFPGDYGDDAAGGAAHAAEAHDLDFTDVTTQPGADNQAEAIDRIVSVDPDLVVLTTSPVEAAVIVGQTAARDFEGRFIGTSPTWNPQLLAGDAGPAFEALYLQSGPWGPFGTDTPGHEAMREALGEVQPNDGYVAGWVWQYPLKAAIERAAEEGDLTREGLLEAARSLTEVDYEDMLPADAGNYSGEPNETVFRQNLISQVDEDAPTGVSVVEEFFTGPTAEEFEFTEQCF